MPPRQPIQVTVDGKTYAVWVLNAGGVLYYTDKYALAMELATLTVVGRAILVRLMLKEQPSFRAIGEPARIRALTTFGTRVESARRDMHLQMATLFPALRLVP